MNFTYWPEMLNWPLWLSQGWLPYKDIAIVHTPLLVLILEKFYQIFGWSPRTLFVFGWLLILLSVLLIRKIAGWSQAILYLILVVAFEGTTVWFESLLVPLLLLVYYFQTKSKLLLAGLFWALAVVTKQTVIYTLPVILYYFWAVKTTKRGIIIFLLPVTVIVSLLFLWTQYLGITADFVYWSIQFVFTKAQDTGFLLLPHFRQAMVLMVLFGTSLIFWHKNRLAFAWMVFCFLFTFPRFGYFHLLPSLAFFTILIGRQKIVYVFVSAVALIIFFKNQPYAHPFIDSQSIEKANWLKTNYPSAPIFVINGPDQLYFLTNKSPSIRPWVPQLPWYLKFYGDDQFMADLSKSPPKIIVFQNYLSQPIDGVGAYAPKGMTNFLSHYKLIKTFPDGIQILERL